MKRLLLFVGLALIPSFIFAKIWTPSVISNNMVLQQNSQVTIWGWTTHTTEEIIVTGSWNNQPVKTKAHHGKWSLRLPTPKAGGPYQLTIKGHEEIVYNQILIGEVWLASGQSNMEWNATLGFNNAKEEVANANYPNIRLLHIPKHQADTPQQDTPGSWEKCTPQTMKTFSATAYFFARYLHQKLDVPIGIINSSWGGTPAEVWVKEEVVKNNQQLVESQKKLPKNNWHSFEPGKMYNAMIAPLIPFKIAGTIWYQGESNRLAPHTYTQLFTQLIDSWRESWGYKFPFYYVQIAPFNYREKNAGVMIREAQLKAMNHDNVGMVVVSDIGNINNIHPGNKQHVGKRLANWALAKTYNKANISYSGPVYRSMEINNNKVVLHFDYAQSGLMKKGKKLTHFVIADKSKQFVSAKAKIKGNTVVVWSNKVKHPVAVRFAWDNIATPNLFNNEGLPASAFRTDSWTISIKKN
ncbi:sialate O-acetylesterase [Prolixibacteraceae bacterium JC049]|nr:sialate O-acetylesterase [Prolixibacteraceae bacterium JC049]